MVGMTERREGDRLPRPCPECGGPLLVQHEQPQAAFDNVVTRAVNRGQCEQCEKMFDYSEKTGRLTAVPAFSNEPDR